MATPSYKERMKAARAAASAQREADRAVLVDFTASGLGRPGLTDQSRMGEWKRGTPPRPGDYSCAHAGAISAASTVAFSIDARAFVALL